MNNTAEEMERRVEATRAEVDRTAEALREKASPSALMDEVVRTFREKGGSDMLSNLGTQVKDNPLPLAMIGAGMAWLMLGSNSSSGSSTTATRRGSYDGPDGYPPTGLYGADGANTGYAGDYSQGGSDTGLKDGGLKDKAADALGSAKSKVSGAAHSVADTASSAKDGLSSAAHGAADRASGAVSQATDAFRGVAQQEPFVIGALGLALGAAIGAALPSTEFEDRHLGQFRDKALDKGKEAVQQAKEVAGAAVDSARSEADRQGVADETRSFVEKAEQVLRAGVDTAKHETQNRTSG